MGLWDEDTSKISEAVDGILSKQLEAAEVELKEPDNNEKTYIIFLKSGETISIQAEDDTVSDVNTDINLLVLYNGDDYDENQVAVFNFDNIAGFKVINGTTNNW